MATMYSKNDVIEAFKEAANEKLEMCQEMERLGFYGYWNKHYPGDPQDQKAACLFFKMHSECKEIYFKLYEAMSYMIMNDVLV